MTNQKKYGLFGFLVATIIIFIVSIQLFLSDFHKDLPVIHTIMIGDIDSSALFYTETDIPVRAERKLEKAIGIPNKAE